MEIKRNLVTVCCLILAAALIGLGLLGGGWRDTMNKAAFICYECIGIG